MKIDANGIATRYELEGPADAPVATLSHSLAANLHLWDAQVAAPADRYRLLRYDIRGHGGSAVPAGPYTLEQMADDLREDSLAIRCPTLVLVGEEEGGTDVTMARAMHERIAGSELAVIPEAALGSCVENPEAFHRALLGFLGRVR